MRHSPLLTTPLASFLMALIAVGVLVGLCLTVSHTAFKLGPTKVLKLATSIGIPAAVAAGLAVGTVVSLGPVVIRFVLAKRILIILMLTALGLVKPLLAVATALAILLAFGALRAVHSRAGAIIAQFLNFKELSWPRRLLYTIGGMLIVLAAFTTPRLPFDIGALLPWPLLSISGLITVSLISIVLGYITGNMCFPRLLHSHRRWAMLAFFCAMWIINPVVGFFSFIHGLLVVVIDRSADDDDDFEWRNIHHCPCLKCHPWSIAGITPGTVEWQVYFESHR